MSASLTDLVVSIVTELTNITIDIPQLNISLPLLPIIHAVLINYAYRTTLKQSHVNIGWLQGFIATVVISTGGGSTAALLRGEPLGTLKSNSYWGIYGGVYWLMFSNPYFYQFTQYLFSIPTLQEVLILADGILRNYSITKIGIEGVSLNPSLGDDKWVAKLILGTLAGCGGGFWIETFRLNQEHWTFQTPQVLRTPNIDMKFSFLSTLFYLITTSPEVSSFLGCPTFTKEEATAWGAMILSSGLIYKSYASKINSVKIDVVPSSSSTVDQQSEVKKDK
ncbi:unnamed protein product [Cunninghamella blakesleeana]